MPMDERSDAELVLRSDPAQATPADVESLLYLLDQTRADRDRLLDELRRLHRLAERFLTSQEYSEYGVRQAVEEALAGR